MKVAIGLVYDFTQVRTIRDFLAKGNFDGRDLISTDGNVWVKTADIPDLPAYINGEIVVLKDPGQDTGALYWIKTEGANVHVFRRPVPIIVTSPE